MPRRQGGSLSGFTPLSTPNAPTGLSVSAGIGSATVSFTAPSDTGDAAITSYIVTAVDESTGASTGATGSASPITVSPGGGTFKIRAQAVNGFGPGRLTEFDTGNVIFSGAEIYTWGDNTKGSIGDNTTISKSSPVQVGALTTWSQVTTASGAVNTHVLAIKTDGTLWGWGSNTNFSGNPVGSIGDGTGVNRSSPVQIGALTNWSHVTGGYGHSCAVKTDGTLWGWGSNNYGQIGDNSVVFRSSPVQIGALTTWSKVEAGFSHNIAIKTDGSLWSWGYNNTGQLGLANTINRSSPVQIGALTNWTQVAGGGGFNSSSGALKSDGTLWMWGSNSDGQLGTNSYFNSPKSSPVQVGGGPWKSFSIGGTHAAAIKTDDTLWIWGDNQEGQLGLNLSFNNQNRSSPVQVGAETWRMVSAGYQTTGAVKSDGTLWTWGNGNYGMLGQNSVTKRSSPVQVGSNTDWLDVSAGARRNMAGRTGVV